jgi:hypothetical protein
LSVFLSSVSHVLLPALIHVSAVVPNSISRVKDQRRRSEGDEWESIKITCSNLVYIPKSI